MPKSSKFRSVWIIENANTGDWVSVCDTLAVAEENQKLMNMTHWTKITEVGLTTQRDIDGRKAMGKTV